MGMAHSLEIREPFLDKDLVEFMLAMPDDFKPLKTPKQLLIDAMGDLLPREIWDRPKMGFSFPWQAWMSRELKPFCTEKLELLKNTEFLNTAYIDGLIAGLDQKENSDWHKAWSLAVLGHWIHKHNIHD